MSKPHNHEWRKRHALQIASQLPEQHDDALAIMALVQELVDGFLAPPKDGRRKPQGAVLVRLRAGAGTSPNLRAISSDKPSGRPL